MIWFENVWVVFGFIMDVVINEYMYMRYVYFLKYWNDNMIKFFILYVIDKMIGVFFVKVVFLYKMCKIYWNEKI